jgi:predicted metallo-beta-lactamase superfamily hydrolase
LVTANPIDVAVSGQTFLNPNVNKTIGNIISIRFLNNNLEQSNRDLTSITDKVKSGKHLVYAARHIIRKEKYDVVLSCVKLENLK